MYEWIRINMQQPQKICILSVSWMIMAEDNWLKDPVNHMDGIWHPWYTFPDSWTAKGEKECRARQIQIYGSRWLTSSGCWCSHPYISDLLKQTHFNLSSLILMLENTHKSKIFARGSSFTPSQHVLFYISSWIMDFRDYADMIQHI